MGTPVLLRSILGLTKLLGDVLILVDIYSTNTTKEFLIHMTC